MILHEAITRAIEGGWDVFGDLPHVTKWEVQELGDGSQELVYWIIPRHEEYHDCSLEQIIFNHDFAKALFGEKDEWYTTKCSCGGNVNHAMGFDTHHDWCARVNSNRGHEFHLKQLAISIDRLGYLAKWMGVAE